MDLIAKCRFPYLTRHLVAGEAFQADDRMGRVLVKIGRAQLAPPASPTPQQPAAVGEKPVKTEPEAAPVLAQAVGTEPEPKDEPTVIAQQTEPQIIPEIIPAAPAQDEPARPAYKSTRRTYGSKAP